MEEISQGNEESSFFRTSTANDVNCCRMFKTEIFQELEEMTILIQEMAEKRIFMFSWKNSFLSKGKAAMKG
jgi:hypothetical protein